MKQIAIILTLSFLCINSFGQDGSVEKSIWSAEIGLFGIWGNNEVRLSDKFVLRSEIGASANFFINSSIYGNGYNLKPEIVLQPRFYYNLTKRYQSGLKTRNNSGNYLGLKLKYNPDWFMVTNVENYQEFNQLAIIPGWGLRRNLGKRFFYEAEIGAGPGYQWNNSSDGSYQFIVDLTVRIGLRIR